MAKKPLGILKKDAARARPPQLKPKKQKKPQPAPPETAAAAATEPKVRPKPGKSAPNGAASATAAALLQGGRSGTGKSSTAGQQGPQQQEQKEWVPHSPVVRFAAEALAKLLAADASQRSGKTIKALTLAPHVTTKKATFALTCQTLRYLPVLEKVVQQSELIDKHPKLTQAVAYVLCYEILFGQAFKPSGPAERVFYKNNMLLRELLQDVVQQAGGKTAEDLLPETLKQEAASRPRYVRVNSLKLSVQDALAQLNSLSAEGKQPAAKGGPAKVDDLLSDVLVLPSGTDMHDHSLVSDHSLILQSKSSCMAAHALQPQAGMHVVDCCSAPGNKTTHLAALMGCAGKIDAFELDPKRASHLQRNVEACGAADIVTVHQADFLETDVAAPEFADVQAVLLDPSCSGSGTAHSRMDFLLPSQWRSDGAPTDESDRLERLAAFQEAALRHALRFPALQRLVYSTCSVHERENEAVVAAVLPEAKALGFRLKDPFPEWRRRGHLLFKGAEKLVRVDPEADGTDGFFIALFERTSPAKNQAGNAKPGGSASRAAGKAASAAVQPKSAGQPDDSSLKRRRQQGPASQESAQPVAQRAVKRKKRGAGTA